MGRARHTACSSFGTGQDAACLLSRTLGPQPPPDAGFCLELQPIKISGLLVYLELSVLFLMPSAY